MGYNSFVLVSRVFCSALSANQQSLGPSAKSPNLLGIHTSVDNARNPFSISRFKSKVLYNPQIHSEVRGLSQRFTRILPAGGLP